MAYFWLVDTAFIRRFVLNAGKFPFQGARSVRRPDEEKKIPDASDIAPGSTGHDRDSKRTSNAPIAHFEQTALSEIRALQAKIDQLAAITITERIAALEEKITVALDKFAEMARATQALGAPALTNSPSEPRDNQTINTFAENSETNPAFGTVPPQLMGASEPFTEPMTPILTAAEIDPNTLLQSYHTEPDGSQAQKKQLQQRISADIERARAELRKRSGMAR